MKSCPTCKRTFEDTFTFCLIDGSVLSAPYDPEAPHAVPTRRDTSPPTEILTSDHQAPELAPTRVAIPADSSDQRTITTPAPARVQFDHATQSAASPRKSSSISKVLIAVAAVSVLGVVILGVLVAVQFSSQKRPPKVDVNVRSDSEQTRPAATPESKSACGHAVDPKIYDKWIELGGETGKLGCPVNDETEAPQSPQGTTGRWIKFEKGDGGYLILHQSGANSGKVVDVSGCMFKLYQSAGGTSSWLGFPLRDGYETDPGARQEFEGGYVVWDRKTYVCDAKKS